jgi:hypothetical protein
MKWKSMEGLHTTSPPKFMTAPLAGKVMTTVFWDMKGVLLVDIMEKGSTINFEAYNITLQGLQRCMRFSSTRAKNARCPSLAL